MKHLKKALCLMLILSLAIPFFTFPGSAEELASPAPGSVLYSEDFETGKFYPLPVRRASGYAFTNQSSTNWNQGRMGSASNHSVSAVGLRSSAGDDFDAFEMIPAEAFEGVTSFTVSFDMIYYTDLSASPDWVSGKYQWEKYLSFVFPSAYSGATGNWVSIHWNALENGNTAGNSAGVSAGDMAPYVGNSNRWEFQVIAGAGTQNSTFSVSVNGTQISTRSNAFTGSPYGLTLLLNSAICELDNITLVDDDEGKTVYEEDFEYTGIGTYGDLYARNDQFTGTTVREQIRANANGHALLWDAYNTAYQGHGAGQFMASFATAAQLQGAAKITVSFDAAFTGYPFPHTDGTYTSYAYFHIGNNAEIGTGSLNGVWVIFSSSGDGDLFELYNSGTKVASKNLPRFSVLEKQKHYTTTYDSANKTFRMWINGDELFNATFTTSFDYVAEGDVMFGLNNRTSLELDNLLVTAGGPEDRDLGITFKGTQTSAAVTDGKYAVRFVAGINSDVNLASVNEIGFKVVASFGDPATEVDYYANGKGACEFVYEQINGSAEGSPVTYTAAELGSDYLIALTIRNIPVSAGIVTFTVAPYYITGSGTAFDAAYRVVCSESRVLSQTFSDHSLADQRFEMTVRTAKDAYPSLNQTEIIVDGNGRMIYISGTNLTEFNAFAENLAGMGFTVSAENQLGNCLFRTFTKKDLVINCGFDPSENAARIIVEYPGAALPTDETFNAATETVCDPLLTQVGLNYLNYESGMSYIVRLRDGRFIVIDGGGSDYDESERLYDLLIEQNEGRFVGKPVIAAWFLTHAHDDHWRAFLEMTRNHASDLTVESVVMNLASPDLITEQTYYNGDKLCTFDSASYGRIRSAVCGIPGVKIVYARTGQQFRIANATVDVWFTPDDMYIGYPNVFLGNDASVIYRLTCEGQTTMFLADAEQDDNRTQQTRGIADLLVSRYGNALKSDMMQIAHHGYTYSSHMPALFSRIDPDVVLWPSVDHWYHHFLNHANNAALVASADEIISASHGTRVLTLPYAAQTAVGYSYSNGDTIYSQDFESITNIRELSWQMNDNLNVSYSTPVLTLVNMSGDRGLRMQGGTSSTISFLCPDYLRNVTTYTVTMDLNVSSLGSGFSLWFNDADPTDTSGRTLYGITETGSFTLKLVVNRSTGKTNVWIDGSAADSFNNASNDPGALIFLLQNADVFVGSVSVVAGEQ